MQLAPNVFLRKNVKVLSDFNHFKLLFFFFLHLFIILLSLSIYICSPPTTYLPLSRLSPTLWPQLSGWNGYAVLLIHITTQQFVRLRFFFLRKENMQEAKLKIEIKFFFHYIAPARILPQLFYTCTRREQT